MKTPGGLVLGLFLLWCNSSAAGQAVAEKIPYATGKIIVTWTKGAPPNHAQPDRLIPKCGWVKGHYVIQGPPVMIPASPPNPPEYTFFIRDLVPGVGDWYCAFAVAKGTTEGPLSVELPFGAVAEEILLAAPTNPRLAR
jgi:hypothetical protein